MPETMSRSQRILAAFECRATDYVPCSFMIFTALHDRCPSEEESVRYQRDMGLDAVVPLASWTEEGSIENRDLPGIEMRDKG